MTRTMLDTTIVGHLLKEHPAVMRHVLAVPMATLCISVITEGALRFGLAKNPAATRLHRAVGAFLNRVGSAVGRCAAPQSGRRLLMPPDLERRQHQNHCQQRQQDRRRHDAEQLRADETTDD